MYSLVATNSTVPLHSSDISSASLRLPSGPRLQWYSRGVSSVNPTKERAHVTCHKDMTILTVDHVMKANYSQNHTTSTAMNNEIDLII